MPLDVATAIPPNPAFRPVTTEMKTGKFNTLWLTMHKEPLAAAHNFCLPLLLKLRDIVQSMKQGNGCWKEVPVHYAVMRSNHPDHFNQGGDLTHFRACIAKQDWDALLEYARLCLNIVYAWATLSTQSITTVALVQGRALGGGFEAALSADFLIAEEHSSFGFPETKFGLFPSAGGMSFLSRRIGVYRAERMMTNNRIYSASELFDMGVVDEVCPKGEGIRTVERFIAAHAKRRAARLALQRSRYRMAPLDYQELSIVVDEWVETARHLSAEELRTMDMLIMMQQGLQQDAPGK